MIKKYQNKKHFFNKNRDVNGILLIDKPFGISSNCILQKVKKIYGAKKAGHTGSLDPIATGMLGIFFGKATKFTKYFLNADKRYYVAAKLGQTTNTFDSSGIITNEKSLNFDKLQLNMILNKFHGNLLQIPPMYSALKYKGIRLYKYARKNIEIIRNKRNIKIYKIKLIFWEKNFLELEIHCSKGTYIRTLIDDIGKDLGCGAHVICLRRLQIAHHKKMISIKEIYTKNTFYEKIDKFLIPIKKFFHNIK